MRVKVEVTAEDIRLGKRGACKKCPVARGTKRALTNASGLATLQVAVFCDHVELIGIDPDHPHYYHALLPKRACDFIEKVDDGVPVKPFSFQLEV